MSSQSRQKSVSITQRLLEQAHSFSFYQAVRILERAAFYAQKNNTATAEKSKRSKNPVALFSPPENEAIRFRSIQSLRFPSSEIKSITSSQNMMGNDQWEMIVNFIGLTGTMGVLPYHYTETILQRLKIKDESMMLFFDMFNHRTTSLFFQASSKYKLPLEYERKQLNPAIKNKHDSGTHALLSLLGFGTQHLLEQLKTPAETLIYYSGILSQKVRTTSGLIQILEHHFNISVEVKQFVGQWQTLIDDVRTRLGSAMMPRGQNACLGRTIILGDRGWFSQGKVQIVLGPLNAKQLQQFSPDKTTLKSLNEMVKLYLGIDTDYDYIIRAKRSDLPNKISLQRKNPPIIGWSTWLSSSKSTAQKNDEAYIDINVSANHLR